MNTNPIIKQSLSQLSALSLFILFFASTALAEESVELPYLGRFDDHRKGRWDSRYAKNDERGVATWQSPPVKVEGQREITISIDVKRGGTNKLEDDDTLRVWFTIDGEKQEDLVSVRSEFPTERHSTEVTVDGGTVQMFAEAKTSSQREIIFMDRAYITCEAIGAVERLAPLPDWSPPPSPAKAEAATGVIQYSTTPRFSESPDFKVKVNGVRILVDEKFEPAECPVLDPEAVDYRLAIARLAYDFDANPKAKVEIDISGSGQTISKHLVSPQDPSVFGFDQEAYYDNVQAEGAVLSFDLLQHKYMLIKINELHYLILIVDRPEASPPQPGQSGVISLADYLDEGRDPNDDVTAEFQKALQDTGAASGTLYVPDGLYMTGQLVLGSNTHLYLASGAMIQSLPTWNRDLYPEQNRGDSSMIFIGDPAVHMDNLEDTRVENVKITGRGVIDGNGWRMRYNNDTLASTANVKLFRSANAHNIHVDGVTFRHTARWSFNPILSSRLTFKDVKLINNLVGIFDPDLGPEGFHVPFVTNSDGFDIDASQDVSIDGCFIFTADDGITPKTTDYMELSGVGSRQVYTNNILWTEKNAFRIGTETQRDMHDIRWEDNHVVHCDRVLSIESEKADGVQLYNIEVLNTRLESIGGNAKQRFFRMRMKRPGSIHNVLIDGLNSLVNDGQHCSSEGYGPDDRITDIRVDNFTIAGEEVEFPDVFKFAKDENAYVDFVHSDWTFNGKEYSK